MSANGHAKRTIQTLEALGFERDDDASSRGVNAYRHPNTPDAVLKVFSGLSEIAAKKLRNRADQILGMASAGERIPASIGENARIRRAEERAAASAKATRDTKAREEYQRAADQRAEERDACRRLERLDAGQRAIRDLMRPGHGH